MAASLLMLAAALAGTAGARTAADALVYAHQDDIASFDPSYAYDAASQSAIYNVYETLIAFQGGSLTKFEPRLATEVPTVENGGVSPDGLTYRFKIRKGVKFQDGSGMTPEDVRYSLLRFMLMDRPGGPSTLLLEPILGIPSLRDDKGRLRAGYAEAARAVSVEGNSVVIRLPRPFAPFLSIMARWSYVVSPRGVAGLGGWDGSAATWEKFSNPGSPETALFDRADGTGPFKLERWDRQQRVAVLIRNESYWGKPPRLRSVVLRNVPEFSTRRLLLQGGDADWIDVSRLFASQLDGLPGVRLIDRLPRLETDPVIFFTLAISTVANPDIGSGKLDGRGIPPDFFKDPDVRIGFSFAFDEQAFFRDSFKGTAVPAAGAIPPGLTGYDPHLKDYPYDPDAAVEHLKKAWGGEVWAKGFTFTLSFNTGGEVRQTACQILKKSIEALNPKFRVNVRPLDWPVFLDKTQRHLMPMWSRGWIADYPDPHNFVFPFYDSQGRYAVAQGLSDPEMDRLVEEGLREVRPARRARIYERLQALAHDRAYQIYTVHPTEVIAVSARIKGIVDNPVFMGPWFYPIRKD